MLLTIKYRSGEIRKTNLHPSFFTSYEVSIAQRAMDFAYQHGAFPYQIKVYRGNDLVFERLLRENAPAETTKVAAVDETQIKKQLRNQFKNQKFTVKYIING